VGKNIKRSHKKASQTGGRQTLQINNGREERAMHKRVLVCLDGSKLAEHILPYVLDEAVCTLN